LVEEHGRVLNGRYRLGEVLGEGGMAVVYRGHDLLLNRPVAIKILREQYAADANFLRRFEREAQSAAAFSHPNIVNIYDVGTDGDQHYIVMEYIRGPSLKELIRRQGPFSVDGAIFVIGQVASALDYAHARGLVHRDIKPQNILVDREGNAKVVDFGIAKGARDVNLTEAGTGMGTVHYVSPEQARGEPATPASDLYSTGVVLFEMLTKRLPFEADTPVGVAMHHVNTPPPAPSSINPNVAPEVDAIVLRALAKEPAERYPSGGQLAAALRHWDMPAAARPHATTHSQRTVQHERPGVYVPAGGDTRPPRAVEPRPEAGERYARAGGGTRTVNAPRGGAATIQVPGQRVPPRAYAGPPRVAAPPRQRTGYAYDMERATRDELGCATWLIGAAILLGILALVAVAFRLGPGIFATEADVDPTATSDVAIGLPTATSAPRATATTPAATATATAPAATSTATAVTPSPTATAGPPTPTVTPEVLVGIVPDLIHDSVSQAEAEVAGRWSLTVLEEASDSVDEGLVIRQEPVPGLELALGETVTIVLSSGPDLVFIPDVRALHADDAQAQLEDLGFFVERVQEPSVDYAEGTVIRTEPSDAAPFGSTVAMYVSLGDVAIVPGVYAMSLDEAIATLEDAGLVVGDTIGLSCDEVLNGDPNFDCDTFPDQGVVALSHARGQIVPSGTPIDIAYYDASL
jgi:serine/threonine-protein kinase